MNLTFTQVIEKWLTYLPTWPAELGWLVKAANLDGQDTADEHLLRWLREQVRQVRIRNEQETSGLVEVHLHFGFGDAALRQRLFSALSLMLAVEAAQESVAQWPTITDWLAQDLACEEPSFKRIQLFNPLSWRKGTHNPYFTLHGVEKHALQESEETILTFQAPSSILSLSTEQPAIYELSKGERALPPAVAARMLAYYSPSADDSSMSLTGGCIAGLPQPVAIWCAKNLAKDLPRWVGESLHNTESVRAATSPGTAPLMWTLGQPKESTALARAAVLKRSSILFFFGRVPASGTYNKSTCPKAKIVVSTTMRPRALTWGEVPKQVVVVQAVPTQALWFGQPSAREINYQSNHFYLTTDSGKEVQLRKLLAAYVQEQDAENAARATEDNTDYVSPLPWNLLHWIRDATTARTVADYIYRQYSQIHLGGERRRKLEGLAKQITDLLAVMQPLWRQLNQLPKERAYVIVPIHVSQPRYLPGFLGLTQDLRTQRLAEFTHLTFIAPSELNVIDNNPSWPVYVTGVQPRYWWALRQLPASNNLHWLLHKELFHDVFCHGALRQFELERDALHRQLWPLTIYANPTDPTLAATELAADLNAASPALPAYRAPSLFNRIGTNIELSTDPAFNISPPLPKKPASKPRPKLLIQQNDEWTALTDEDQAAAREVGRIPSEAALAELDDAVLHISPAQRTPDDVDQAIRLQEAEDVEELVTAFVGDDAESAPFATGLFTEEINSSIRQLNARARRVIAPEERPVWVHRHSNEEWMLEKCLLADVRSGEHFLDEKQLRESLRRAATKTASATRSRELPFWKQALREFAYKHYRYNPERLYRHMVEGRFGDIKLHVAEATFLRTYLAWDNYCQPVESTTRVPGSWQNRNAIYQVIGSQSGQIDEMQLLHREERWRRTLSNQEEASLRQEYQKVRRELLAWWQQCTIHNSGQISQDTIKQSLVHHVSLHPDKFKVFYDTDHRKLPEFTEDIYEYFISILTAALLKK